MFRSLILCFLIASPLSAAPKFYREPYLQMATDSSMTIVWRTEGEITATVKIGKSADLLDVEVPAAQIIQRQTAEETEKTTNGEPLHSALKRSVQYEATVKGLEPDTRYYYGVFDGESRLTPADVTFTFRTHPVPGTERPLYFWVVGDGGTGGRAQVDVSDAMVSHLKKEGRTLDMYLHLGDMAYGSGTNAEFSDKFFTMYAPTLRNTVCWPVMGNHEGKTSVGETGKGPYYDAYACPTKAEAGGLASGTETYYSYDFGKVHFIALNSHDIDRRKTGAMAQWLKADLESTSAEWLLAFWHHPPYTKGSHDSDTEHQLVEMREQILPILEAGGVDVVFTGHSHIYERSMLIDGAYATPTVSDGAILDDGDGDPAGDGAYRKSAGLTPNAGDVQIVAGHGGTTLSRKGTSPIFRKAIVEHGSVLVSVDGNTLTSRMLNYAGEIRDTFSIVKEGEVAVTRIEKPWQPEKYTTPKKRKSAAGSGKPVPKNGTINIIAPHAKWRYVAGAQPPAGNAWAALNFDDSRWKADEAGFGYGDNDDTTKLDDMKDNYPSIYLRNDFNVANVGDCASMALAIRYDDGFIAYINGHEVLRVDVDFGAGRDAKGFKVNEATKEYRAFSLSGALKHLKVGRNVIAIEGHNADLDSSDFTLDPYLYRSF